MKKLFSMLTGLLIGFNVHANGCGGEYQASTGTCRIIDSSGREILYNIPNRTPKNSPQKRIEYIDVLIPSKFGAIASSKEGLVAGAINMNSKEEAKKEAVARCERNSGGSPCKVVTWVRNGCVAAAKGKLKGKYIVSTAGDEQGKVENTVLKQCKATGAAECQILLPEGCSIP